MYLLLQKVESIPSKNPIGDVKQNAVGIHGGQSSDQFAEFRVWKVGRITEGGHELQRAEEERQKM